MTEPAQRTINFKEVNELIGSPRRRCSFAERSGLQTKKSDGSKTFSVYFSETVKPIVETDTGIRLSYSTKFENYWTYVDDDEVSVIEKWEARQGNRVFIRDRLALSIALDMNFCDDRTYTRLGELEHRAKNSPDEGAIQELVNNFVEAINDLPFYRDAKFVCSVPPRPEKHYDLPSELAERIGTMHGICDVTDKFEFRGVKRVSKSASADEKWQQWEDGDLVFQGGLDGKDIILIDDKYQSGVSMQFVAKKLLDVGAARVFGITAVKTWSNVDNTAWSGGV